MGLGEEVQSPQDLLCELTEEGREERSVGMIGENKVGVDSHLSMHNTRLPTPPLTLRIRFRDTPRNCVFLRSS